MVKEIIETKPLTLAEVKNTLSKRGKKGELSYIQRVTLDHTTKFSSITARAARSLVKKLVKQFEIEEYQAIQIINVAPTTTEELTAFLAKAPRSYTKEEIAKILEIVEGARKKSKTKGSK